MSEALPLFFVSAMGLSLLLYVILDGFDLGVGMLLPFGNDAEKDTMIASIGPFWDANETWIVMGVGVLLIAFPKAHGIILTALYIPVTIMLVGLILRGAAFDFRVKSADHRQPMWNKLFALGSLMASMAQGWMLGAYITGLTGDAISILTRSRGGRVRHDGGIHPPPGGECLHGQPGLILNHRPGHAAHRRAHTRRALLP